MAGNTLTHTDDRAVTPSRHRTRLPAVDVRETEDAIILIADMPGVDQDGLEVVVHQDVLTVRGALKNEGHGAFEPVLQEYEVLDFERAFSLPSGIDAEAVTAAVKNGVVTVTLPKTKEAKPRRIEVNAG